MQIGMYNIGAITLPGAAGKLQRGEQKALLLQELGRNYVTYHAFLSAELDRVGQPRPEDCRDFADYTDRWRYVHHLVNAEMVLRISRSMVVNGSTTLNETERVERPLIDASGRLASVLDA